MSTQPTRAQIAAAEPQQVVEALVYALDIIESYQMDIRNSEDVVGVDLEATGFCQGRIYRNALAFITRLLATPGLRP